MSMSPDSGSDDADARPRYDAAPRLDPPARRSRTTASAPASRAGTTTLLVASALLSLVWIVPLVLAFFALANPIGVYQGSPAEPRKAFTAMSDADQSYVATLIRVFGGIVGLVSFAGIFLTWGPVRRGRPAAFGVAATATLAIVVIAAWLHAQGFWAVYPIWAPGLAWILGLAAGFAGLAMLRRDEAPPRAEGGRPIA